MKSVKFSNYVAKRRKRKKDEIRKEARKLFISTLSYHLTNCFYCDRKICWREKIRPKGRYEIVKIDSEYIILKNKTNGFIKNYLKATIEHIKPLVKGGENSFENLTGACVECNLKQGRQYNPTRKQK